MCNPIAGCSACCDKLDGGTWAIKVRYNTDIPNNPIKLIMGLIVDHANISTLVGTPNQVMRELNRSQAKRVVMVAFDELDPVVSQAVADNLHDLANMMLDLMLQRHNHETLEKIVELLVPRKQPSKQMLREAAMLARAKKTVLEDSEWLTASELADLAQLSTRNPSAQPNKWKKSGKIFAIHHAGVDYFPGYALDPATGYRPMKAMAQILRVLSSNKDSWGIAIWFASQNSFLAGQRPLDVLHSKTDHVLAAAIDEAQEIGHG